MKTIQKIFLTLLIAGLFCASAPFSECFAQNTAEQSQPSGTDSAAPAAVSDKAAKKTNNAKTEQDKNTQSAFGQSFGLASSAGTDNKPQEEIPVFSWGSYFKAIGVMLFLLLIFWYVLKIVRKVGNGRFLPSQKLLPRDSMYLEGQLPLGQGKSIVIVRVLNERLVLGVTEKNINLLTKTGINHAETFEELMQQAHAQGHTDA